MTATQQPLMQRILMGANGGNSMSPSPAPSRGGLEDIAARLHRQNGMTNGTVYNSAPAAVPTFPEGEPVQIGNNTPILHLTCDDCGIYKSNSEDMEVHIKMEHLNWLPFQCPICLSERASDAQMREHLHSSHRKNMNKFIYVDNVAAKRQLQVMMDRAMGNAIAKRTAGSRATISATTNPVTSMTSTPSQNGILTTLFTNGNGSSHSSSFSSGASHITPRTANTSPRPTPDVTEPSTPLVVTANVLAHRKRPIEESSSNTDALLASINRAADGQNGHVEGEVMVGEEEDPYAGIFHSGKRIKSEFDTGDDEMNESSLDGKLDTINPIAVLDDVAALFANSDGRIDDSFGGNSSQASTQDAKQKSIKTSNQSAKKRVLGECSKCKKPVTAGARQMHMFFHLAKDHGIFRFRCRFEGCATEHYRKDQMENHQSKMHGKIEPEMMEDRSLELFHRCQELTHELFVAHRKSAAAATEADTSEPKSDLSMELLGTKSGSVPGPTAAKAEIAYQAAQALKDKNSNGGSSKTPSTPGVIPEDEHPLECRECHKTMRNRIRGFHILWHLARDMGINRYICRICQFGHDRSQSVQNHGKKEHGTEDVVEDRIAEYQEQVKYMSEKCFGFQALFARDGKRRSKIPLAGTYAKKEEEDAAEAAEEETFLVKKEAAAGATDDISQSTADGHSGENSERGGVEEVEEDNNEDDDDDDDEEGDETFSKPTAKRKKRSVARFGISKKVSKARRAELAKMREISMLLNGAQYIKKRSMEALECEKCEKLVYSKFTEHACTHMDDPLFLCPACDVGHQSRDMVLRHIKEMHDGTEKPIDNRLPHAKKIKEVIKMCYPHRFVDAPLPTAQDIEKMKAMVGSLANQIFVGEEEHEQHEEEHSDAAASETTGEAPDTMENERMLEQEQESSRSCPISEDECGLQMEDEEDDEL